jgi:hypothetical protein
VFEHGYVAAYRSSRDRHPASGGGETPLLSAPHKGLKILQRFHSATFKGNLKLMTVIIPQSEPP